jgi:ribosome-binding protein aMBF1 (putative translation factor)
MVKTMGLWEAVAENIKIARAARGLSQAMLAARCEPPTVQQKIDKL